MRLLSAFVLVIVTAEAVRSQQPDNLPPTLTKKGKRPARFKDYQTFQDIYRKTGGAANIRKPGSSKPIPRPPQKNVGLQSFWQNNYKPIRHPEVLTRESKNAKPEVPVSRPAFRPRENQPLKKQAQPQPKPAPIMAKPAPIMAKPAPVKAKPAPIIQNPAPIMAKPAPVKAKPAPTMTNAAQMKANSAPIMQKPAPILVKPAPKKANQAPIIAKTAQIMAKPAPVEAKPANWATQYDASSAASQQNVQTNRWTDNVGPSKPSHGKMPQRRTLPQTGNIIHPPVLVSNNQGVANQAINQGKPDSQGNKKNNNNLNNLPASFSNQQNTAPAGTPLGPNGNGKIYRSQNAPTKSRNIMNNNAFISKSPASYQKPQPVNQGKGLNIANNGRRFRPAGMQFSGQNQVPDNGMHNTGSPRVPSQNSKILKQSMGQGARKQNVPRKFGPPVLQNNNPSIGIGPYNPGKSGPPMPQGRFGNGPWANNIPNGKVFKQSVLQRPVGQNNNKGSGVNQNEGTSKGNNNNKPNVDYVTGNNQNNNVQNENNQNSFDNSGGAAPSSWPKPNNIQISKPINQPGQQKKQQGGRFMGSGNNNGSPTITKTKLRSGGRNNILPTKYHPAVLTRPKKIMNSKTTTNQSAGKSKQVNNGQNLSVNKQSSQSENGENGEGVSQPSSSGGNANGGTWNNNLGFQMVGNNKRGTPMGLNNHAGIKKGGNNNGGVSKGSSNNNGGVLNGGLNNNGGVLKGASNNNGGVPKSGPGNDNGVGPKGGSENDNGGASNGGDSNGGNNNGEVKKRGPSNNNGGVRKAAPSAGPIKQPCAMNPICGSDSFTYMSECFMSAGIYKVCDGFCPCPTPKPAAKPSAKSSPYKTKTKTEPSQNIAQSVPVKKNVDPFKTRTKSGPPPQSSSSSTAAASKPSSPPCKCGRNYNPVCGENGDTYNNDCLRRCNGVRKACSGSCPCQSSGQVYNPPPTQPPATVRPYTCEDFCPTVHKPVCSAWGHTFSNDCVRECSGEPAQCNGACPCLVPVFIAPQPVENQGGQEQNNNNNNNNNHYDYNYEPNNQPLSTCECRPGDIDPVCTMDGETLWYGCQAICLGEKIRCSSECPC